MTDATTDALPQSDANMAPAGVLPPQVQLQQMIMAGWISQAISLVAKLKLCDLLAGEPRTIEELAEATGTLPDPLGRVLRTLSSVGVFQSEADGRYSLTPVGQLLRSDTPGSLRGMCQLMGDDSHWRAWGNLEHSVRTAEPAFDHTFGTDFFTYAAQNPETSRVFNEAMTSIAHAVHSSIADCYDFSGIGTIMDVGGGHGTLLASILKANPEMKGVLFDLPHVVEGAPPVLERWGVADRCEIIGGDFFAGGQMPGGVDACVLSMVIHDWDDARSVQILSNCHASTRVGGKLLLGELVIPDGPEPAPGKFMDLNMLVMTPGGRERTEQEYGHLLTKCGYDLARIVPTQAAVSIVEGIRR